MPDLDKETPESGVTCASGRVFFALFRVDATRLTSSQDVRVSAVPRPAPEREDPQFSRHCLLDA